MCKIFLSSARIYQPGMDGSVIGKQPTPPMSCEDKPRTHAHAANMYRIRRDLEIRDQRFCIRKGPMNSAHCPKNVWQPVRGTSAAFCCEEKCCAHSVPSACRLGYDPTQTSILQSWLKSFLSRGAKVLPPFYIPWKNEPKRPGVHTPLPKRLYPL